MQSVRADHISSGSELMQLYEGDKVEVVRMLTASQAEGGESFCECRFENLVGVFPLRALKLIAKKINASVDNG